MASFRTRIETGLLPLAGKPNRYVGNFQNGGGGWKRAGGGSRRLRVGLVHPDLFEPGLVDAVTREAYRSLAGRAFADVDLAFRPWPDMEALLAEGKVPLWGLESMEPLSAFDLLVMTPASALQLVPMLGLIERIGLPLPAAERPHDAPLIALLGAVAGNPAPAAPFIDLALIGEPAAILPGLAAALAPLAGASRAERRAAATGLPGVLDPSRPPGEVVRAAITAGAGALPWPAPYLPLVESDEEAIELVIRRGGTAARFDPGPRAWRPPLEMGIDEAVRRVEEVLPRAGLDMVTLAGDQPWAHGELSRLVEALARRHPGLRVRLDDFGPVEPTAALARELSRGRRSSFTWSPLAGSARLRAALNAPCDEAIFLSAVATALRGGCHMGRLRFGIGWPTETEEDVDLLCDLVLRVKALPSGGAPPRWQVQLSPFSPRPHTPFEREAEPDVPTLERRIAHVRRRLEHGSTQVRTPPPVQALIEARLARGGPDVARVLVQARRGGADLAERGRPFEADPWLAALEAAENGAPAGPVEAPPPWSAVRMGLPPAALRDERQLAAGARLSPLAVRSDEARECLVEVETAPPVPPGPAAPPPLPAGFGRRSRRRAAGAPAPSAAPRFRIRFVKADPVRFTAHLDTGRLFERALRRLALAPGAAKLAAFKISFGPPLPLGMTGEDEYLDLQFPEDVPENGLATLAEHLPPGLSVAAIRPVRASVESLSATVDRASYAVWFPEAVLVERAPEGATAWRARLEEGVARVLAQPAILVPRKGDGQTDHVDCRPSLLSAAVTSGVPPVAAGLIPSEPDPGAALWAGLEMTILLGPGPSLRPEQFIALAVGDGIDPRLARVHRLTLRISGAGRDFSPLEVVEPGFPWWRETKRRHPAGTPS